MSRKKSEIQPTDLNRVKRYSIRNRSNRMRAADFGRPMKRPASADFFESLPKSLKAAELNEFIDIVARSRKKGRPFHLLLGAHVIKVGLSPVLIDLMQKNIVTGLSFNCAGLIHDLELAFWGGTSEDVLAGLEDGSFGMVRETGDTVASIADFAADHTLGLGEAAGAIMNREKAKYRKLSVFATAQKLGLPVTVHVGIGTDIISQHPVFDAAKMGAASHLDFRTLCSVCSDINKGGVVANIGSAVILPEVFLKALTVARNIYRGKNNLTAANFDMIYHYRPRVNIVERPTHNAGKGFNFVGHHEIMVPLLAWGLKRKIKL